MLYGLYTVLLLWGDYLCLLVVEDEEINQESSRLSLNLRLSPSLFLTSRN